LLVGCEEAGRIVSQAALFLEGAALLPNPRPVQPGDHSQHNGQ
jgi:hypothetical protein